jgi:O-antigen ligase
MGSEGCHVASQQDPAAGSMVSSARAGTGTGVARSGPGIRRRLSKPGSRTPGVLALVTAATATLEAAWVVLSGAPRLALLPVAVILVGLVIVSNRQAAAYVMLASLPFAEVSVGTGASLVRYILIGVLAAWFVGVSVFEPFEWLAPDRTDITVLAWVIGSVASAAFFDGQAARGLSLTYLNLALVYYVASRMIRDARQARGAVLALSMGLSAAALLTLARPGLAGSFIAAGGVQRLGPLGASGAFGINRFAAWLAVGSVLPWAALREASRPMTLAARGLSIISVIALVQTVSKAGLIALAVGVLCWVALSPRRGRVLRGTAALVMLGAGWLLLPAGAHIRFAQFQQPGSVAYSRFAVWDAGLRMFLAHPVTGIGVGNFAQFAPAYFPQGTHFTQAVSAHNIVIGALAETGIVGAVLLATMIGTILLEGIRLVRADRAAGLAATKYSPPASAATRVGPARLAAGLTVGYVVFLTGALSVDLERDRFFLVLAGLVHGLYRAHSRAAA